MGSAFHDTGCGTHSPLAKLLRGRRPDNPYFAQPEAAALLRPRAAAAGALGCRGVAFASHHASRRTVNGLLRNARLMASARTACTGKL